MIIYNVIRSSVQLTGNTPFLALVPGTNRSFMVLEIDIQGMGNASAANEIGLYQIGTAGTGAGTAITAGVNSTENPNMTGASPALAFSGNAYQSYASAAPVVSKLIHNGPVNSNGQRLFYRVNANLNNAIVVPGASLGIALAPISGTGVVSVRLQIGEL